MLCLFGVKAERRKKKKNLITITVRSAGAYKNSNFVSHVVVAKIRMTSKYMSCTIQNQRNYTMKMERKED